MKFLNENDALVTVKKMLSTQSEATLVVAFWGEGAIEALGLDRRDWKSLRVVCNLDSGACNPHEIEKLLRLAKQNQTISVRSDPRLHGKVYLIGNALVLGSSNASSNGLVVEGAELAGWAEANIYSEDTGLISAVGTWCDARFADATEISSARLDQAKDVWAQRKRTLPSKAELTKNLLDAYRSQPDHSAFKSVKLTLWTEGVSTASLRAFERIQSERPVLRRADVFEDWGDRLRKGDWLIDFDLTSEPTLTGYWKVTGAEERLTFVEQASRITLPGLGRLSLDDVSELAFKGIATSIFKEYAGSTDKGVAISLAEASQFLAKSTGPRAQHSLIAEFEQAILDIYEQASSFGYRPTELRRMIHEHGAIPTAQRLVMSRTPSPGFIRLLENNRLDLAVETLVLKEEWKGLFSDDVRRAAVMRLRP